MPFNYSGQAPASVQVHVSAATAAQTNAYAQATIPASTIT